MRANCGSGQSVAHFLCGAEFFRRDPHLEPMSKLGLIVAALLSAAVMAVAYSAWRSLADVAMSTSGYVAMVLGALATLAVGAGLMGLVFWSNRKGFDERAGARPEFERRDNRHN
jgi:hypothetical protein